MHLLGCANSRLGRVALPTPKLVQHYTALMFNPETLTSTGSQPLSLSPPQNPGQEPEVTRPPRPGCLPVLDEYWDALLKGSSSPRLHPGSSGCCLLSPPGGSVNPNTLPSTSGQPGSQPPLLSPPLLQADCLVSCGTYS